MHSILVVVYEWMIWSSWVMAMMMGYQHGNAAFVLRLVAAVLDLHRLIVMDRFTLPHRIHLQPALFDIVLLT